jgi:hypothetical protein
VDDLALAAPGSCLVFIVLGGRVASPAVSSLTPRATIRGDPSGWAFLMPRPRRKGVQGAHNRFGCNGRRIGHIYDFGAHLDIDRSQIIEAPVVAA